MKIKQLIIHKSRTIAVEGKLGRDAYRKIEVGMVADLDSTDENAKCFAELSDGVDKGMAFEIEKLNDASKSANRLANKGGGQLKQELLG